MNDEPREWVRGECVISTDRQRLDIDVVHGYLASSYWASGMPRAVLERGIENSLTFGIYHRDRQAGFARVITDLATYAYLSDVFVLEAYRGQGLSKWLVECILAHPDLQGLRRFALFTRDAEGLYERYGFGPARSTSIYLERWTPNAYAVVAR
ncbi:MAG TPA: GNAT family N-acetyltransferase [Gemmatimonadaceae bacterium]|jgi:GNAT superfamily N-acetyltransferase|nr:GNAT family N-acetyltransferase [Gemmatimonadaceae bacterium]